MRPRTTLPFFPALGLRKTAVAGGRLTSAPLLSVRTLFRNKAPFRNMALARREGLPRYCGLVGLLGLGVAACAQAEPLPYTRAPIPSNTETVTPPSGETSSAGAVDSLSLLPAQLRGAPFLFRPTDSGFGVNAVLKQGSPASLVLRLQVAGSDVWGEPIPALAKTADLAEWQLSELTPDTRYDFEVLEVTPDAEPRVLHRGSAVTQRSAGVGYSVALLSDSHIGYNLAFDNQGEPAVLAAVGEQIAALAPDFIVNLGDIVDFHQFGFNDPPPDGSITRGAYLNYREALGSALGSAPHFNVIGNWEGENGNYSAEAIQWSREQRMLYMPGPEPTTYPLGGSPWQDYYAFTWGDATYFVLNVMTYTPTEHLLSSTGGAADDWTLGPEQLAWFEGAVRAATSRWKFVLIHHAVGGKAGDEANSRYGRGGGLAANVGEQATIHQLMRETGVQVFFYGHDHVFVDMTVDGIHYTQPGSAGAPWKFDTAETGYTEYWSESGWARLDVAPASVHVTFFSSAGTVLYDYGLE